MGFVFPSQAEEFSDLLSLLEQNTPLIWCPEPQVLEHLLQELTYENIKNENAHMQMTVSHILPFLTFIVLFLLLISV